MPQPQASPPSTSVEAASRFLLSAVVYGPVRPDRELHHLTQRALKGYTGGEEFFTDITLRDARQPGLMSIDFSVTASSPGGAQRAGIFYLGQLCDLLSAVPRQPLKFLMPGEDSQQERIRGNRTSTHTDRILTEQEWQWIIGSVVQLRLEHPRFLAAASWYRKGLCGIDPLEVVCCFWRVIERLSLSYADKSSMKEEDRGRAKPCVRKLAADLDLTRVGNGILQDDALLKRIVDLRNDVSHGNEPITPKLIEEAADLRESLEEAAFKTLQAIRQAKLIPS